MSLVPHTLRLTSRLIWGLNTSPHALNNCR